MVRAGKMFRGNVLFGHEIADLQWIRILRSEENPTRTAGIAVTIKRRRDLYTAVSL